MRAKLGVAVFLAAALGSVPARSQVLFEDFESYPDTNALDAEWQSGQLDTTTPNPVAGSRSLRRALPDVCPGCALTVVRFVSPAIDLSGGQLVGFWARRDPSSVGPVTFSLSVDSSGNTCGPLTSPITDSQWHRLVFELEALCPPSVNLAAVTAIALQIRSNLSGMTGFSAGNWDDFVFLPASIFADGFESGDTWWWSSAVP